MNTQDLKEKLLEDKEVDKFIADIGGVIYKKWKYNQAITGYNSLTKESHNYVLEEQREIVRKFLSQIKIATQEIKKGETKRIAYQQGYREATEEMILHIESDIHENEQDPDVAIINVRLYFESLKNENI